MREARRGDRRRSGTLAAFANLADVAADVYPMAGLALNLGKSLEAPNPTLLSQRCELPERHAATRMLDVLVEAAAPLGGNRLVIVLDQIEIAMDQIKAGKDANSHWSGLLDALDRLAQKQTTIRVAEGWNPSNAILVVAAVPTHRIAEIESFVKPPWPKAIAIEPNVGNSGVRQIVQGTFDELGVPIEPSLVDQIARDVDELGIAISDASAARAPCLPLLSEHLRRLHQDWKAKVKASEISNLYLLERIEKGLSVKVFSAVKTGQLPIPLRGEVARLGDESLIRAIDDVCRRMTQGGGMDKYQLGRSIDPQIRLTDPVALLRVGGSITQLCESAMKEAGPAYKELAKAAVSVDERSFAWQRGELPANTLFAERLLRRLVDVADPKGVHPAIDTLRSASIKSILPEELPILQALLRRRLVVYTQARDSVRLVHEAILRYWPLAADWRAREAEVKPSIRELRRRFAAWREDNKIGLFSDNHRSAAQSPKDFVEGTLAMVTDVLARWGREYDPELTRFIDSWLGQEARKNSFIAGRAIILATYFQLFDYAAELLDHAPNKRRAAQVLGSQGRSTLMNPIIANQWPLIQRLLRLGADPSALAKDGVSALHHAAMRLSASQFRRMVKSVPFWRRRAALRARTLEGHNAFSLALTNSLSVAAEAEHWGAERFYASAKGLTPLHMSFGAEDPLLATGMCCAVTPPRRWNRRIDLRPRSWTGKDITLRSDFVNSIDEDGFTPMGRLASALEYITETSEALSDDEKKQMTALLQRYQKTAEMIRSMGGRILQGWSRSDVLDPWPRSFIWTRDGTVLAHARRELQNQKFTLDVARVAPISFLKGGRLIDAGRGSNRVYFLENKRFLIPLGQSGIGQVNAPIYQAMENEAEADLNDGTLIDYCRFFFHVVRGRLGSFHIVESADDLHWIDRPQAERDGAYAACAEVVRPPRLLPHHADGRMQTRLFVQFKNALFETTVAVTDRGLMELLDENLVIEELPVTPPKQYLEVPEGELQRILVSITGDAGLSLADGVAPTSVGSQTPQRPGTRVSGAAGGR
jgi:hypothetical protein